MEEIFNQTPLQFVDLNTLFDALNEKTGLSAEQFKALVENTYWLKNNLGTGGGSGGGTGGGTVDSIMSDVSTNAVQNKIIKNYVDTSIQNAIQSTWEASY